MSTLPIHYKQIRHFIGYRGIAIFMVLLFVAGSARQIIPEMCATQQLAEDCVLPKTSGPILGSCCTTQSKPSSSEEGPRTYIQEEVRVTPCAFCVLVTTASMVTTTPAPDLPILNSNFESPLNNSFDLNYTFWLQSARRGPPAPSALI